MANHYSKRSFFSGIAQSTETHLRTRECIQSSWGHAKRAGKNEHIRGNEHSGVCAYLYYYTLYSGGSQAEAAGGKGQGRGGGQEGTDWWGCS